MFHVTSSSPIGGGALNPHSPTPWSEWGLCNRQTSDSEVLTEREVLLGVLLSLTKNQSKLITDQLGDCGSNETHSSAAGR